MCKHPLHPFLASLPKIEHHMHLEGSLGPDLLFRLATANNVILPSPSTDPSFASPQTLLARYENFASLDDFLAYYYISMSVLQRESDFEALAWEYFRRAKADGVMHAEVFFDPQAHTGRGVKYEVVRDGFERACRRAEAELGLSTKLIVCFLRHLPVPETEDMFVVVLPDLKSGRLAAIGLDSSEVGFPPSLFEGVYRRAREEGIRRTAHAGEEGPAESVWGALRGLDVQRVDHGISIAKDGKLVEEVARRKMLVTMCPLSNVRLKCVKNVGELPIRLFLDKGVRFSINSDDPAYFGGYILDNYCAVQESFALRIEEWETIVRNSIEGSWCDDDRKTAMGKELASYVSTYTR
ncbi:adenine deaminase [Agyrium rufum]|nr:adenine deaminase [Agyrium rufum]